MKLNCGQPALERPRTEAGRAPPAAGAPGPRSPADAATRAAPKNAWQIDELRKDNLITEQEYRAIRKRILDDL